MDNIEIIKKTRKALVGIYNQLGRDLNVIDGSLQELKRRLEDGRTDTATAERVDKTL